MDVEALGWSEGETGCVLVGRREIEGLDSMGEVVAVGVGGVDELFGARGVSSSSSAFLLGVFEKGWHLNGSRGAGAGSTKTEKGECVSRRRDIVLLMAALGPQ